MASDDEQRIPDGVLRIFQMRDDTAPSLCIVRHTDTSDRYGCIYVQFPDRGYPTGGSSWSWPASCFREPATPTETLWVWQYLTAKRVRDLEAELVEAKADAAAVQRYSKMVEGAAR